MNMKSNDKKVPLNSQFLKAKRLFLELKRNPNFVRSINLFRIKYHIPLGGFTSVLAQTKWESEYKPLEKREQVLKEIVTLDWNDAPQTAQETGSTSISEYDLDLFKILNEHRLSVEWQPFLNDYILFGKPQTKLNPYEVYLTRIKCGRTVITEEINLSFGATMQIDSLTKKINGKTNWASSIEPFQKLMNGYKEKKQRPSKLKTAQQIKIDKLTSDKNSDQQIYNEMPDIKWIQTIRQHRKRYKGKIKPYG